MYELNASAVVAAAGARVEILTGPNAGRVTSTDFMGKFRFAELAASPAMKLRASKAGQADCVTTVPPDAGFVHSSAMHIDFRYCEK